MNGPLKDKGLVNLKKNSPVLWRHNGKKDALFSRVVVYQHDDVRSAVEWLKDEVKTRDIPKGKGLVLRLIDKAFQDAVAQLGNTNGEDHD